MTMKMKNKRGWIRIIEVFVAILIILGVLLIVLDKEEIEKKDVTSKIYLTETAILREIQLNNTLREDILNAEIPVEEGDDGFPSSIANQIDSRTPAYLSCMPKICQLSDACDLDEPVKKNTYVRSVAIVTDLETYDPRQLKLFCWTQ